MKENKLQYNAVMNLLLSLSQYVFPMLAFAYAVRILGAEGIGNVSFAISYTAYYAMVAALGIPTYGIRACAEARKSKNELSRVTSQLLTINFFSTMFSVAVFIASVFILPKLRQEYILFMIAGTNIISNGMQAQWFFQGIEEYGYITKRTLLFRVLSLSFIILFVRKTDDIVFYCIGLVLVEFGAFIVNTIQLRRHVRFVKVKVKELVPHIKPILYFFASATAISIYTNLDVVMLGFLAGDDSVGYYSVANKIYRVFNSIIAALFAVFVPRISSLISIGKEKEVSKLTKQGFYVVEMMALPISAYLFFMSDFIIKIIAGDGYAKSEMALLLMGICNIFVGYSGVIINLIMIPRKREKYSTIAIAIGAVENIILNAILIPKFDLYGATLATVVTEFSVLLIVALFERNLIKGFVPKHFLIREFAILLLLITVTYGLKQFTFNCSFIKVFVMSCIWAVIALGILLLFRNELCLGIFQKIKLLLRKKG